MAKKDSYLNSDKSILYNRGVLYFIFILALGYLFYILTTNDFFTLSIFVIIGFLTSFFSKNMVVILSLAMAVSFIFKFGTKIRAEGFEDEIAPPPKKKEAEIEVNTTEPLSEMSDSTKKKLEELFSDNPPKSE